MLKIKNSKWVIFGVTFFLALGRLYGQEPGANQEPSATEGSSLPPSQKTLSKPGAKQPKLSPRQRRKQALRLCNKYNGKLVSYYEKVFQIVGCERVPVNHTILNNYLRAGKKVTKISADVIYLLPLKKTTQKKTVKSHLNCRDLEGHYVTSDHEVIYYVKGCRKKKFPDWPTYHHHRFQIGVHKSQFFFVDETLLNQMKSSGDFRSTAVHSDQSELLDNEVVLSKNQVCRELEGQYISYFSQFYKVEGCQKRPVDALRFSRLMVELDVMLTKKLAAEANKKKRMEKTEEDQSTQDKELPPSTILAEEEDVIEEQLEKPDNWPEVIKVSSAQWVVLPLGKPYTLNKAEFLKNF
ncbi:MAG: hypothetical protein OXC40_05590 [Proteobacteria bacterium]|nr:hypothetical protein [Pseudomonadota bacterium]